MSPRVSLSAQSQLAFAGQLEQGAGRVEDDDVCANLAARAGGGEGWEGFQARLCGSISEKGGGKSSNPWPQVTAAGEIQPLLVLLVQCVPAHGMSLRVPSNPKYSMIL